MCGRRRAGSQNDLLDRALQQLTRGRQASNNLSYGRALHPRAASPWQGNAETNKTPNGQSGKAKISEDQGPAGSRRATFLRERPPLADASTGRGLRSGLGYRRAESRRTWSSPLYFNVGAVHGGLGMRGWRQLFLPTRSDSTRAPSRRGVLPIFIPVETAHQHIRRRAPGTADRDIGSPSRALGPHEMDGTL